MKSTQAPKARNRFLFSVYSVLPCLVLFLYASFLLAADKPNVDDVTNKLSCYCGGCPHLPVNICGCPEAGKIKADVAHKLEAGMTEKQIIDGYVAQYGQTILSMPPSHGFNLTAWVIPFLGFAIGGVVLVTFLKRQRNAGPTEDSTPEENQSSAEDEYYRQKLLKELESEK
ncbi:MAG: hypothetical protein C5B54_01510 [Acidobacteria bacterium]|nr:MAG: hypothetical protein C5B54_01510 [Acidobacteriota bacterium]